MRPIGRRKRNASPLRFGGDGFLYRMVRNIVGCLVKVGTGSGPSLDFAAVMAAKDRKKAGVAAPACGLSLVHVSYPEETAER